MIDPKGHDRLLLRNPANYKAGFWTTFVYDSQPHAISSTEPMNRMNVTSETGIGTVKISAGYNHHGCKPLIELTDSLWSKNKPMLFWRHSIKNTGRMAFEDVKAYLLMDFDIGGPNSYKDDSGQYDPEKGIMTVWDENHLFVQLTGNPKPSAGEVSTPVKLVIDETRRDLGKHLEMGPRDIVIGLQWNLGNIDLGEIATVDVALVSAVSLDEVRDLTQDAWSLFDRKMR
ncbi:MAG: hypothetical protein ACFFED_01420 [Candidatus Thorarchaeota archaeon]